jgi:hypothetical protein
MLERHEVTPEIGAIYDALLQQRGVVPNMFKVLASIPALAQGVAFLKPIVGDGALPAGTRNSLRYASACYTGSNTESGRTRFPRNRRALARSR